MMKESKNNKSTCPPSFLQVSWKEIVSDKFALVSLFLLVAIILFVVVGSTFLVDVKTAHRVDIFNKDRPPDSEFFLGTDSAGRDMVTQMIVGAKNSFVIAFSVTILSTLIGGLLGLISGFYGGALDNITMRVVDFLMMLPRLMLIIVLITLLTTYDVKTFVIIMSVFSWMHQTRLIRTKSLQQASLDFVSASKTLGTPNLIIMFREVLPNIFSLVVVNFTLSLAGNMGLETGLSFLGFGLPSTTPSLGTLTSIARSPEAIQNKSWQWLPATLLVFLMMLCINFVGQAFKRASDAKQRTI